MLFAASVRDNIRYGSPDATNDEVEARRTKKENSCVQRLTRIFV